MLQNYLIIALRTFRRNTIFSFIHVLGLAIGISASLVIYLIVRYENNFDRFEADGERVYRVVLDLAFNGMEGHSAAVPAPMAAAAQSEMSGIEAVIPVMQFQGDATAKVVLQENGKATTFKKQPGIVFTNDQYFELLPFRWIAGSSSTALKNPFSIVLTESRAKQYFPHVPVADLVGKQLQCNDLNLQVTGVVYDLNKTTDLTAVEFISYATIAKTNLQDRFMMNVWNDWMTYSRLYIKLASGTREADAARQMNTILRKYNPNASKDVKNRTSLNLQPLRDIHFNTNYASFGQRTANKDVLYGLLAIAAFLLLLACINFTNLSTAQASQRAREIGIRKTVGGSRKQLIQQFLSETFLITLLAALLSLSGTPLLLDLFADFLPPGLTFNILNEPSVMVFLACLVIVVSLLAGIYPALVLAGYQPAVVLKNHTLAGITGGSSGIRKALTVSQFVIAQFFVIAAFMVSKQIHYSLHQDLGFRKEAIINFDVPPDTVARHQERLLNEIASFSEVQAVSKGFLPPSIAGAAFSNIVYQDGKNEVKLNVQLRFGDPNYLTVYQIGLAAGRNVQEGAASEVLINEDYARKLGFKDPAEALGKELTMGNKAKAQIVGVMKDFHESSFHAPINPIVFQARADGRTFHVALYPPVVSGGQWQDVIARIQKLTAEVYPDHDFTYRFFDDSIADLYAKEKNISKLLNWATGLSILISCLGLLGLVIYTSATRTKEIGIRKILGASVSGIVTLLSREFIYLVVIAFVIAAPVAWWAIGKWLEGFAYRTPITIWVFVVCGLTLMLVALLTLSIQTIRTAMASPVDSLRAE